MSARDDLIALARTQVGTVERVNNRTKYGLWYGMDGNPWCAMFLSWLHGQLGQSHLVNFSTSKGYAYTPSGYQGFKNRGRAFRDAQPGDHVFFQFSGPRIHHVGLVIGVGPGYIDTIEGNTSRGTGGSQVDGGGVWYRRRASGIVGYGRPAYASVGTVTTQTVTTHTPIPTLEDDDMLLFWHKGAVYLFSGGKRSPWGLAPQTVDAIKAGGVKLVGKPDDDSQLFHMAPAFK